MFHSITHLCILFGTVFCGPNLCENGAKIDSIAWVSGANKDMWFFTSGGHYWYVKEKDFPPISNGIPLPGGFKKGEAAFYRNSKDACATVQSNGTKPVEQEIYVLEAINGENQVLKFNTKNGEWLNGGNPISYAKENGFRNAKVKWTLPFDATFIYKMNQIVVIQNLSYSVVDISSQCSDPNGIGNGKEPMNVTDFKIIRPIDAITDIPHDKTGTAFHLFQDSIFFNLTIQTFEQSNGKFVTKKSISQDIDTQFFKFKNGCKSSANEVSTESTKEVPSLPPKNISSETTPYSESKSVTKEEGFPWIVVIIIVVIIALIAIALIVCLTVRNRKPKNGEEGAVGVNSKLSSTVGGKSRSKTMDFNLGDSPSTMSVRSNAVLPKAKNKDKGQNKN